MWLSLDHTLVDGAVSGENLFPCDSPTDFVWKIPDQRELKEECVRPRYAHRPDPPACSVLGQSLDPLLPPPRHMWRRKWGLQRLGGSPPLQKKKRCGNKSVLLETVPLVS